MMTVPTGVLLLRMILRRAWALILVPAVVGVLAFLLASQAAPVWTSHSLVRLHIDNGGPSIPGVESTTSQWAVIGQIATQLKLFQSRTVLSGAGEQELYDELVALAGNKPLLLPNGVEGDNPIEAVIADHDPSGRTREALAGIVWSGSGRVVEDAADSPEADAFVRWALSKEGPYGEKALRDAVKIQRIGESDLVTLTMTAEHRSLAPRLLAATMDRCIGVLADSKRADSDHRRAFFEQRVREAKERLNERELALKSFLTKNDIANYTDQTRALALQIEDTRMRLAKASEDAARFDRRRRGIEDALGGPEFLERWKSERATDAELLKLRESVAAERAETWLEDAAWTNEGSPPPAPSIQARVDTYLDGRVSGLEPHRKELVYDWLNEDLEFAGSEAGRTVLQDHLRESEEDMQRYAALGSEIKRMEREIDVAEREYLELLKGLNAANLLAQQADGVTPFSVVDAASVPREAEPRGRALTAVMGAVLAFGLVVIVVLVVESLDQSLRTPASFETAYDLPVLGGLPHLTDPANPTADASATVQQLLGSLTARVANAAEGAQRVQVVAMQPQTGTSVMATSLAKLDLPVDDRAALAHDSAALRPQPDTVSVWVVRSGDTLGPAEQRALRDLEDAGAPVVGLVINELTYAGAEELLGSVPRPRTRIRQAIKRLAGLRLRTEGPWRPVA